MKTNFDKYPSLKSWMDYAESIAGPLRLRVARTKSGRWHLSLVEDTNEVLTTEMNWDIYMRAYGDTKEAALAKLDALALEDYAAGADGGNPE